MIVDHPFFAALALGVVWGANMFLLAGCANVWHDGDPSGVLRCFFPGVLKVCVPKMTGLICAFITLISLSF